MRARVHGTKERPRLAFFRSNMNIYAQIINDDEGKTLVGIGSIKSKAKTKTEKAEELGGLIAKKALESGIDSVVFDRGGFLYTGTVEAFAGAARKAGLKF